MDCTLGGSGKVSQPEEPELWESRGENSKEKWSKIEGGMDKKSLVKEKEKRSRNRKIEAGIVN